MSFRLMALVYKFRSNLRQRQNNKSPHSVPKEEFLNKLNLLRYENRTICHLCNPKHSITNKVLHPESINETF